MSGVLDLDGNVVEEVVQDDSELKRRRVELFDWLGDLNFEKRYLFNDGTESDFDVFIIRRGMSQNIETIMYANELNKLGCTDKRMTHDFFFYGVSKKKRYGKWAKGEKDADVTLLAQHYGVNRDVAAYYLKILTADELKVVKEQYVTGGRKK